MEQSKDLNSIKKMFASLAGRYDLANRVMSLGQDIFWREALAKRIKEVEAPARVLDMATGTGDQLVAIKKMWPEIQLSGLDLSTSMLAKAGVKFDHSPGPRPSLIEGNALEAPFEDAFFDSVSISFGLRNLASRDIFYAESRRLLKNGGRLLVLEMYHDPLYWASSATSFYLRRVVPHIGACILGRMRDAYEYLSQSVLAFPQPRWICKEMSEAGFKNVQFQTYAFHSVMLVWGDKY